MTAVAAIRAVRIASDDRLLLPSDDPMDVLITDGRIVDIAPTGALRLTGDVVEGDGGWLLPGLWDHHVHVVQWALSARRVPLGDAGSAAEAARIMAGAPVDDDGRRVGSGFRSVLWPDAPDLALLDAATGEVPTYLINADVHSVWLNSAAFRREGIAPTDDGQLVEADAFEISRRLNAVDPAVADRAVLEASRRAAARGIVGIRDYDMVWNADPWRRRLAAGFDAHHVEFGIYAADLDRAIAEGLRTGEALDAEGLVRVGGLKTITDGSLGTRTAACTHGYADDPANHGILTVDPEELRELLTRATGGGLEAAVHAIGDVALSAALDAFAVAEARGTIEHLQLARHADLARMARVGIGASIQPQHAVDDRDAADELWSAQTALTYPLGSLHRAGIPLLFGSDAPVAPLDPWLAISAAVHRSDDDRPAWRAEERLDIGTALRASMRGGTHGGAAIAPGAAADLIVIDRDPETASAAELRTMPVRATMLGGRLTHGG